MDTKIYKCGVWTFLNRKQTRTIHRNIVEYIRSSLNTAIVLEGELYYCKFVLLMELDYCKFVLLMELDYCKFVLLMELYYCQFVLLMELYCTKMCLNTIIDVTVKLMSSIVMFQTTFLVQCHIEESPETIVDNALRKWHNHSVRKSYDYILKVVGQEDYLYGDKPIHLFKVSIKEK